MTGVLIFVGAVVVILVLQRFLWSTSEPFDRAYRRAVGRLVGRILGSGRSSSED